MIPISYALSDVAKRRLPDLLRDNSISAEPTADGRSYLSEDGKEVLVVHDSLVETTFSLPGREDMCLHASLMCSGAKHFGNEALAQWPERMLSRRGQLLRSEDLVKALPPEASNKDFGETSGTFELLGRGFIFGVRVTPDDELQSFVVMDRDPNIGESSETWEQIANLLKECGFYMLSPRKVESDD